MASLSEPAEPVNATARPPSGLRPDELWPDVGDSGWLGGAAEGWERAPYWLDGAVPLAFLLDHRALKEKVVRYVGIITDRQHPDGWLGPKAEA